MFNQSPKRKVGGSNPLSDAKNSAENVDFSRFSAFSFSQEKSNT